MSIPHSGRKVTLAKLNLAKVALEYRAAKVDVNLEAIRSHLENLIRATSESGSSPHQLIIDVLRATESIVADCSQCLTKAVDAIKESMRDELGSN